MFSQPKIKELFNEFVTVQLYTDTVPVGINQVPSAVEARDFRDEKLENYALPYYVVLKPNGKVLTKVAFYEKGVIPSAEEFEQFLRQALQVAKKV